MGRGRQRRTTIDGRVLWFAGVVIAIADVVAVAIAVVVLGVSCRGYCRCCSYFQLPTSNLRPKLNSSPATTATTTTESLLNELKNLSASQRNRAPLPLARPQVRRLPLAANQLEESER